MSPELAQELGSTEQAEGWYPSASSIAVGVTQATRIVKLKAEGSEVIATFALTDRSSHRRRGIDERASIAFRVRVGRITALHQIGA